MQSRLHNSVFPVDGDVFKKKKNKIKNPEPSAARLLHKAIKEWISYSLEHFTWRQLECERTNKKKRKKKQIKNVSVHTVLLPASLDYFK